MGCKTRKGRTTGRARSEGVGEHQRRATRASMIFSTPIAEPLARAPVSSVWRLVHGCGELDDVGGENPRGCGGFRLVCPKPADVTMRLLGAGRERQQHNAVLLLWTRAAAREKGGAFRGGDVIHHQNGLASTRASLRTTRTTWDSQVGFFLGCSTPDFGSCGMLAHAAA